MNDTDLNYFALENFPKIFTVSTVYLVRFPRPAEVHSNESYSLYIEIDEYDYLVGIQPHSNFFGKKYGDMDHDEKRIVWDWLMEMELLEWRRIGPEDSELFATKRLTSKDNNDD
jgi:hypothetical protein